MTGGPGGGVRAAVDIGTNSVRLLVVADDGLDLVRWQRVTGLGTGVDASGSLSEESMARTVEALRMAAADIRRHEARKARAVATSAVRDATNRRAFIESATSVLGFEPEVIGGEEEARLSYLGATGGRGGDVIVIDIGGGSTEFVTAEGAVSVDIGSVRLSERARLEHPCDFGLLEGASALVASLFDRVPVPEAGTVVMGVAGTWTSLAAIQAGSAQLGSAQLGSAQLGSQSVHRAELRRDDLDRLVGLLASLSLEETERLPGLDPARAPVILGGALVARESMRHLGADRVIVSEHDLLDGVVAGLGA